MVVRSEVMSLHSLACRGPSNTKDAAENGPPCPAHLCTGLGMGGVEAHGRGSEDVPLPAVSSEAVTRRRAGSDFVSGSHPRMPTIRLARETRSPAVLFNNPAKSVHIPVAGLQSSCSIRTANPDGCILSNSLISTPQLSPSAESPLSRYSRNNLQARFTIDGAFCQYIKTESLWRCHPLGETSLAQPCAHFGVAISAAATALTHVFQFPLGSE
jgi:hypothetical protein